MKKKVLGVLGNENIEIVAKRVSVNELGKYVTGSQREEPICCSWEYI